ncbi:AmmeMemoRadiSam system radical SAM enzyme [Thermodesulfobacteriota bacterium]
MFLVNQLFGLPKNSHAQTARKGLIKIKRSPYFHSLAGGEIQCDLCPKQCLIPDGKRGLCRVRENRKGKCYSLVYGNPCVIHLDPIERKPFLHVAPGSNSLSIATAGCNFDCKFCQNWEIALAFPEEVYGYEASPEIVVKKAKEMDASSIAYSYVEPTIFYEYMYDIACIAKKSGLLNVMHTNGFINDIPLIKLCRVLDAAQVDLKGFNEAFYHDLCNGELAPVLQTLKIMKQEKIHLEITNLVIPTKNDDMSNVREMCLWIKGQLGKNTPVHFNRFYPLHKLNRLPSTPVLTLEKARETAISSGLEYVYIGNVPGHEAWNTFCPKCGKMIIKRVGYMIEEMHLEGGTCRYCGNQIPGVWA